MRARVVPEQHDWIVIDADDDDRLLARCAGGRTATEIAHALNASPGSEMLDKLRLGRDEQPPLRTPKTLMLHFVVTREGERPHPFDVEVRPISLPIIIGGDESRELLEAIATHAARVEKRPEPR
jgi:hypothetical protein